MACPIVLLLKLSLVEEYALQGGNSPSLRWGISGRSTLELRRQWACHCGPVLAYPESLGRRMRSAQQMLGNRDCSVHTTFTSST